MKLKKAPPEVDYLISHELFKVRRTPDISKPSLQSCLQFIVYTAESICLLGM